MIRLAPIVVLATIAAATPALAGKPSKPPPDAGASYDPAIVYTAHTNREGIHVANADGSGLFGLYAGGTITGLDAAAIDPAQPNRRKVAFTETYVTGNDPTYYYALSTIEFEFTSSSVSVGAPTVLDLSTGIDSKRDPDIRGGRIVYAQSEGQMKDLASLRLHADECGGAVTLFTTADRGSAFLSSPRWLSDQVIAFSEHRRAPDGSLLPQEVHSFSLGPDGCSADFGSFALLFTAGEIAALIGATRSGWNDLDVTADGRFLLTAQDYYVTRGVFLIFDAATGDHTPIHEDTKVDIGRLSGDGRYLFFLRDSDRFVRADQVDRLDRMTGELRQITQSNKKVCCYKKLDTWR